MKVVSSIRAAFDGQLERNKVLKEKVDALLDRAIYHRWHYESRLKQLESFALKIETGRCSEPNALEDFFGCTVVVQNLTEINSAEVLIEKYCDVKYRRPKSAHQTAKYPDSFPFDDLRLYVTLKQDLALPPEPLRDIVFEIQVKTFLQHAWSIATHDLIYKGDNLTWGRERIAYHIKAMIEQAEVSISGVDLLANLPEVKKDHLDFTILKKIQDLIKKSWPSSDLPIDILRLSRTVAEMLKLISMKVEDLDEILKDETAAGRGPATRDLSPYTTIIQAIINQQPSLMEEFSQRIKPKGKICLPLEVVITRTKITRLDNFVRW
ncbi:MAG: hypothetical protein QM762_26310 [Chryseolinea sp.]